MYKCDNCGNIFEEPATWREERSGDGWAWESMSGSPCCNGGYEELYPCECCGEPTDKEYCEVCEKNLQTELEEMAYEHGMTLKQLIKMIYEVFGGGR